MNDGLDLLDTQLTLKTFSKELELVYEFSGNFMSFLFVIVLRRLVKTWPRPSQFYSFDTISKTLRQKSFMFYFRLEEVI